MAKLIQAINAYGPRLALGKTVQLKQLVDFISSRTGLNKGEIQIAMSELSEAIIFFNKQGQGVKLEGLGTYLPGINTKGDISVTYRLDTSIKNALNAKGAYQGEIKNRENIGKTNEEYIQMWNADHSDDPIS
jgi:hypothetical protein